MRQTTIETRLTEERYKTSDPDRLLNKYISDPVVRSWADDFMDEETAEVVSVERNEILFTRGTFIDRDTLSQIQFYLQSGDISAVEISNQRRIATEIERNHLYPHIATVMIDGKGQKILFYTPALDVGCVILKDFIELNYTKPFWIRQIKDFDASMILIDNLKKLEVDEDPESDQEDESDPEDKKFYQIEFNVESDGLHVTTDKAVVQTFNVERAMMLINDYIIKREKERIGRMRREGLKYDTSVLTTSIESAKSITVHAFIPREFSIAYTGDPTA